MKESGALYPPTPLNVPPAMTEVSPAFRKEVKSVMGAIVLFFFVYILMFTLSILLIIGCVYAGIAIIINIGHLLAIFAGIGLVGLAVMIFIFLIKFLFSVSRFDRSQSVEVTEAEQPILFGFIRQLTEDTQTPFPKKIYLSPDVNACVFYDSSFWSMFLPIRKNLQIGLGLVNAINVSEFKAVMAHEFGHFSQRSMKLGSFVYNVNRIIHDMLFNNTGYATYLNKWAGISDVFAFFAGLTARIAQGIQWVLQKVYGLINVRYMSLSREMEFHADAVAATVSGSRSLVTALRRIEIADTGFSIAVQKCNELFGQQKVSTNIYPNQLHVLDFLATSSKLEIHKGLPVIPDDFAGNRNTSRVNYSDQWASHPSTADREKRLMELGINAVQHDEPAWVLFQNKEQLQAQLTEKMYAAAREGKTDLVEMTSEEFLRSWKQDIKKISLPEAYKGFYDNRMIEIPAVELENEVLSKEKAGSSFEELFGTENLSLPKKIAMARHDLEVLRAISDKRVRARTFDFDGQKYSSSDAASIADGLEEELKQDEEVLKKLDHAVISFFLARGSEKGMNELENKYRQYFQLRRQADAYLNRMNSMLELLGPIYAGQTIPIEQIQEIINNLKQNFEPGWKTMTAEWIDRGVFEIDYNSIAKLRQIIQSDYQYFDGSSFIETELTEFNEWCHKSWAAVQSWLFSYFKSILEMQLVLVEEKAVA